MFLTISAVKYFYKSYHTVEEILKSKMSRVKLIQSDSAETE